MRFRNFNFNTISLKIQLVYIQTNCCTLNLDRLTNGIYNYRQIVRFSVVFLRLFDNLSKFNLLILTNSEKNNNNLVVD